MIYRLYTAFMVYILLAHPHVMVFTTILWGLKMIQYHLDRYLTSYNHLQPACYKGFKKRTKKEAGQHPMILLIGLV